MRVSFVLALLLAGCAGSSPAYPDPVCDPAATPWSDGRPAFREATDAWGLTGLVGVRLVAVDFDGDGFIDLHVHRGNAAGRERLDDPAARSSWLLRNDGGRGFVDVTESSGFRQVRGGGGAEREGRAGSVVSFGDVDGDGDLDAISTVNDSNGDQGPDRSELLINGGDGTFTLGPDDLPWSLPADNPAAAVFVDYDRDGRLDVWMPRSSVRGQPAQDHLYRGDGLGGFTEVTSRAGMLTAPWGEVQTLNEGRAHSNAWSGAACDLNGDGWPELLASSYGRSPNHLWQNNGDGTFANRGVASGYAFDGNQEYLDNQFFACFCQANRSAPRCAEAPAPRITCQQQNWRDPLDREPYRNGGNSGSTVCADVDNDGNLDLLTSEIQHWWAGEGSDESELLFNTGAADVAFERPGNAATGLTRELPSGSWDKGDMTNAVFDFDNDGWKDVFIGSSDYPGTRALLWHQSSPRRFSAVETSDFFEHTRSHGVAVADFDNDGDLDVVVGHSRSRCGGATDCYETQQIRLFLNELSGNFVQLDLEGGLGANLDAVGARVSVTTGGLTQTFEVGGGYGHFGAQAPHRVHAGLGPACEATVEVVWPDAARTTETATLPAGYRYSWRKGDQGGPVIVGGATE
jgi:hypothetical protein